MRDNKTDARIAMTILAITQGQSDYSTSDRARVNHVVAELGRLSGEIIGEVNALQIEWLGASGEEKAEINQEIEAALGALQKLLDNLRAG